MSDDTFYNRVILGSVIMFIIAGGVFFARVKYVEAHPYNTPSTSSTSSSSAVNISTQPSNIDSLDYKKMLSNGGSSVNFAFGVLEDMAQSIYKQGGCNMYVESFEKVNQRTRSERVTISGVSQLIKNNNITNMNEFESIIAKELMNNDRVKMLVLGPNCLGISLEYFIHEDSMTFTIKVSHSK